MAFLKQSTSATIATHIENGYYSVPIDTTDTGTLGRVNFIRNTSADFSACNAIINNSTFNNNLTQISANFS